jgi:hypothetical protein
MRGVTNCTCVLRYKTNAERRGLLVVSSCVIITGCGSGILVSVTVLAL